MSQSDVKSDLHRIADRLDDSATYADAMYELYLRMKIATGRRAGDEGRVIPHDQVKSRFAR